MAFQRHFFLFFVLCSSFLCSSQAYKFNVGWVLNLSETYDEWAGKNRFQVNDVLVFEYKKGSDSVLVVHNETDYKNCNKTNPIKKLDDGDSEFSFDRSGPFYFISGKDQNCNNGQKLIVVVLAVRKYHHYPSVPPALSPVAKPPASPSPAATHPTASPPLAPSPEAYTPATPPTSTSPSPAPAATPPSLSPSLAPSPEAYTPALPPASPSPAATPEAYTPALTPASPSPAASTPEAGTPAITPSSSSPVATPESSPPSPPEPTTPSPSTALSAPANSPEGTPSGNETVPAKTAPAPSSAWAINPTNVSVGLATLVLSFALSGTLCAL